MLLMRWQLAYPGKPVPLHRRRCSAQTNAPGGIMLPEFYNQLGAMHGTIMVFLAIVPLAVGAFGNYVVPLQIGAPDMAFPQLNMASYWVYFVGGVIMFVELLRPGRRRPSPAGPPIRRSSVDRHRPARPFWLIGMVFLITSSLLGSVNFIATIIQLRAPGMTWMRLPFFVWAQLVTAFLLLLAFPPLEAAAVMQLMDRVAGTSFFLPTRPGGQRPAARTSAAAAARCSGSTCSGSSAHPEVYVLILPAMGIVAEIIANNTRKPLWGYKSLVYSALFLGFMSFIVWAHHMFLTGMGTDDQRPSSRPRR